MQVIFFLFLFLTALLGSHAIVYVSLVHFFSITVSAHKYILVCILIFLAVSFFLSSAIAHFFENGFTRAYYFLSGFWLGFLVNIIMALAIAWLTLWVSQYLHIDLNKSSIGAFFLGLALLLSLYGVWHALRPVVKNISVRIPNLPEQWKGETIVHLSDIHLGHVYQASYLEGVVEKVNALHPKMVVITGDLFDGMDGYLGSLVQPFNGIQSDNGIFFVTGNHETYLGIEKAFSALQDTKVVILKDEVRDVDGLQLIGISFPKRGEKKDLIATLESLRDRFSGQPSVLLYHAPARVGEVAASGVNLMLSGHTHRGQQFPFRYITHLVHAGYDYGLYRKGDFSLYTTSGVGTWGPTMRIGTQSEIVAITLE
ncbi:MAG: metallophosphoesterase [Candidatus Moranbacteria bacterium]|nr:metallophosphoesterase [Candidatus Moranbacteria bacterium]